MASTSVSFIQKRFKYDVFLSFRGEDTCKTFVDHLYKALDDKGIITYKDDDKTEKGERISEQLMRSIEDSRIYIIVFSKNYASSSWCLDELVKIMKCQKMTEHTAYPIFFDVEPTEVCNQSGAVGEAFAKHEKLSVHPLDRLCCFVSACYNGSYSSLDRDLENKDDVGKWRNALKEATSLVGIELKNTFNGHVEKFIQQIVQDISLKLRFINFTVDGKLVGMETRVMNVLSSLEIGSEDVRVIGIKGIGGGGKTALARAVFDHISTWFEGKFFVENVREGSKGSGLKELQQQILSLVLNDKTVDVASVSDGKQMLKTRMRNRMVLVVLDDVDTIDQLEALAGELTWFKPGSRIIITTRDEQVLVAHGVHSDYIHDVNLLTHEEAICLFSKYAFKRDIPNQGYEELSRKVVHYAAGLPLTVKVLGSHLCGRSELEWVDTIERLKTIPLKETLDRLEISYDSLEDDQKEIFLDIVCLLKGERIKKAIKVLESLGYNAQIGMRVLEQKSLITINDGVDCDDDKYLAMHDHLEEMGQNIVRRLHPNEPSRHSRLWIRKEIEDILVNKLGTKATRSIKLNGGFLHPAIVMKGLEKMKKLRYLYLHNYNCDAMHLDLSHYLPNALRFLYWHHYPFCSLPKTFQANELVSLIMSKSNITELWEGGETKVLKNLRFLNLEYSKLRTFDLGLTPHLEELKLKGCYDFVELHFPFTCPNLKSINVCKTKVSYLNLGMTPYLERLDLKYCHSLQVIHAPVGCLKNLYFLELSGCLRFTDFSFSIDNVDNEYKYEATLVLIAESLDKCPLHPNSNLPKFQFKCEYGERLPSSSGNLEKLISFGLCACTNLESFSASICGLHHLNELTLEGSIPEVFFNDLHQLESLKGLKSLELRSVESLEQIPKNICRLECLKSLTLKQCVLVEKLPEEVGRLESLEKLKLEGCESLQDIPDTICKMKCLKSLDVFDCFQVEKLPEQLGSLECLEELNLEGCESLRDIPDTICNMKCLKSLKLSECILIEKLSEELGRLQCLEELDLTCCKSLQNIPNSICNMKCLKNLKLPGCILIEKLPEELGRLECLEALNIKGCKSLRHIPNSISYMKCLKSLCLSDCILVEKLPEELGRLESLENLNLEGCESLRDIPETIYNMKCLKSLCLSGCILIEKLPKELGRLECLEELNLKGCKSLRHIPNSICNMKWLTSLNLSHCSLLKKLPEELGRLECLKELDLALCYSLRDIPNSVCNMKCLKSLYLSCCILIEKLPEELGRLKCLEDLDIKGTGIKGLPHSIYQLKGLCITGYREDLESYGFTSLTLYREGSYYVEM